jgi:hypothetical protein
VKNGTIGSVLVAVAIAVSASAASACDRHADAVEAKGAKDAKDVAAGGDAKGCSMPCCAKAKAAAVAEKPGPEKSAAAGTASKTKPAHDAATVAPAADAGTHR